MSLIESVNGEFEYGHNHSTCRALSISEAFKKVTLDNCSDACDCLLTELKRSVSFRSKRIHLMENDSLD
ncbi:hypothetical protein MTR_2g096790 [Medicago truncatula]|uniref:Uncharacterized protein n=1 Tax=Medicago truncatula TaxID=3880 RepID=A0A072VDC1_MEDTR|nr:hypothetical protein MTR_2g096790 [Medicago truncatula]